MNTTATVTSDYLLSGPGNFIDSDICNVPPPGSIQHNTELVLRNVQPV